MYDVAIVGCGPVGLSLAVLLGQRGHKVYVHDRRPAVYPLSRAGSLDDETFRTIQAMGLGEEFFAIAKPLPEYSWVNEAGDQLLHFDWTHNGPSGWPSVVSFYSPELDALLLARLRVMPNVTVRQGWEAQAINDCGDHIGLDIRPTTGGEMERVESRYLVGADGAKSFVRKTMGLVSENGEFSEQWLVVDHRPNDPDIDLSHFPPIVQLCVPARPVSWFRYLGRQHMRWEFMLLSGEQAADFESEEACLRLMAPWVGPDDGKIVRRAVYRFESALTTNWRLGRVMIAGDAAHLMPPFLGQGMCSGMRDAINLEWKLDMVLRGLAPDTLLDSYQAERRAHVSQIIDIAIQLGKIVCESDPVKAAERDAMMLSGQMPPPPGLPPQAGGLFDPATPLAGRLGPQGRIAIGDRQGLIDDIVGRGWHLLTRDPELVANLTSEGRSLLYRLGTTVLVLDQDAIDLDGTYHDLLTKNAAEFVLMRPDFYIQGAGKSATLDGILRRVSAWFGPVEAVLEHAG